MLTLLLAAAVGQIAGPRVLVPYNTPIGMQVAESYVHRNDTSWVGPPAAPPKVIYLGRSYLDWPGITGRVIEVREDQKLILLAKPLGTVWLRYTDRTRFKHVIPNTWPTITKGTLLNADSGTITVIE